MQKSWIIQISLCFLGSLSGSSLTSVPASVTSVRIFRNSSPDVLKDSKLFFLPFVLLSVGMIPNWGPGSGEADQWLIRCVKEWFYCIGPVFESSLCWKMKPLAGRRFPGGTTRWKKIRWFFFRVHSCIKICNTTDHSPNNTEPLPCLSRPLCIPTWSCSIRMTATIIPTHRTPWQDTSGCLEITFFTPKYFYVKMWNLWLN